MTCWSNLGAVYRPVPYYRLDAWTVQVGHKGYLFVTWLALQRLAPDVKSTLMLFVSGWVGTDLLALGIDRWHMQAVG